MNHYALFKVGKVMRLCRWWSSTLKTYA